MELPCPNLTLLVGKYHGRVLPECVSRRTFQHIAVSPLKKNPPNTNGNLTHTGLNNIVKVCPHRGAMWTSAEEETQFTS